MVVNTLNLLPSLDPEEGRLYNDFILSRLSEAAYAMVIRMLDPKNYEWQAESTKRHRAQGKAEGEVGLLLKMLTLRVGALPDGIEAHLIAATAAQRAVMAERLLTASTLDEVLGA